MRAARGRGFYRAMPNARIAIAHRLGLKEVGLYAKVNSLSMIVKKMLAFQKVRTITKGDRRKLERL